MPNRFLRIQRHKEKFMANKRWNSQISNLKQPKSGSGVKPVGSGSPDLSMPERTASWPGLPGKSGPDRSNGSPEEKVYVFAQGLRGGKEVNDGEA